MNTPVPEAAALAEPLSSAIPALHDVSKPHSVLVHPRGADPWVITDRCDLVYTHTGITGISIWRGSSLETVAQGEPVVTWKPDRNLTKAIKNIWAPEIHQIDGRWYIYYAADDGDNNNHRMYAICSEGRDPFGPYQFCGKVAARDEDRWAIDGTIFAAPNGDNYFIWSGWPGEENGRQNLYIARMRDAVTLEGPRALLTGPEHPWESWINEGPQILTRSGKSFLVYSANRSWTDEYRLGILRYHGGDPLSQSSWEKHEEPVFDSHPDSECGGIFAPGHCSFTLDPIRGEDWIVYHVAKRRGAGWVREVRAQRFYFGADGFPHFGRPQPLKNGLKLSTKIEIG